jgi:hypothetical protein
MKSDGRDIFESDQTRQQQLPPSYQGKNGKISISEHREQYYQTVRKQSAQSPGLDSALERIPEYSEGGLDGFVFEMEMNFGIDFPPPARHLSLCNLRVS